MAAIKILTQSHVAAFARQPKYGENVILKLFLPSRGFYWYISEYDPQTGIGFGFTNLDDSQMAEMGSIDLYELVNLFRSVPVTPATPLTEVKVGGRECIGGVERDMHFPIGSMTLSQVREKIKAGGHV